MELIFNKQNLLRLSLSLYFVKVVFCDANFELKLIAFSNPSGKEHDGDCCESIFGGSCSSSHPCDPELTICVSGSCYNTGEYKNQNSFNFGNPLRSGVKNPYTKLLYPTWPGSITVTMDVKDKDNNDHDHMGYQEKTFQQTPDKTAASSTWKDFTFTWKYSTHTMEVRAQARVYCKPYYFNTDCGTVCLPRNTDEHGHYYCDEDTGAKICLEHYYGNECKIRCEPQDTDTGHYTCGDNGQKICLTGWTGADCTDDVDECADDSTCSSNGNCTNLQGSYSCDCDSAYTGKNCSEVKLYCDENPCSNNSTCNNTLGGYECICKDFWRGRHCDQPPYCFNNTCSNNTSACNNTEDGYMCVCNQGWRGETCTEEITPCTSSPCLNGGACNVIGGTYNCDCVGQWEGNNCQTEIKETFTDNRTIILVGELTPNKNDDLKKGIKDLMTDLGFPNATVESDPSYDGSTNKTTVVITVSSHNPDIQGALQDVPNSVFEEYLPLSLASSAPQTQPTAQPVAGLKSDPWVKQHWYAILLIVLALIAIIAAGVIFLFVVKKRRTDKLQKSGFDHDQNVRPVNGAMPDAAIGFDNSLYYEIRQPEAVEGLPNGKY